MSKQIISEEFKRMQKLAGLITENEFYGDYDEDNENDLKLYHDSTPPWLITRFLDAV